MRLVNVGGIKLTIAQHTAYFSNLTFMPEYVRKWSCFRYNCTIQYISDQAAQPVRARAYYHYVYDEVSLSVPLRGRHVQPMQK